MKKLFFIFSVILMAFAVLLFSSCYKNELMRGQAGEILICKDSDNGKNISVKGRVTGGTYGAFGYNHSPFEDYCTPQGKLVEYFCLGNAVQFNKIDCPAGTKCEDGACLPETQRGDEIKLTLTLNESISGVLETRALGHKDMPKLLAAGTFEEKIGTNSNLVPYKQTLRFIENGNFIYTKDGYTKITDYYLVIDEHGPFYVYTIDFGSPVKYDKSKPKEDLVGAKIILLGREYYIKDVDADGIIRSLTLSDGSNEYKLKSREEVEVNGVDIDGTLVTIEGGEGSLLRISYEYTPDDEIYLAVGRSFVDPVFKSFGVILNSVDKTKSPVTASVSIYQVPGSGGGGTCTDSDYGKNYYVKGNITGNMASGPNYDSCLNNITLREVFCNGTLGYSELYNCPNGCKEGVCIATPLITSCTDSDDTVKTGESSYYKSGYVIKAGQTFNDTCYISTKGNVYSCEGADCVLIEMHCGEPGPGMRYKCPNGCKDGACLQVRCIDSDGGIKEDIKGILTTLVVNATDYCIDNSTVMEYYCYGGAPNSTNGTPNSESIRCQPGKKCVNGACI